MYISQSAGVYTGCAVPRRGANMNMERYKNKFIQFVVYKIVCNINITLPYTYLKL
jgi:hypothetical protein